MFATGIPFQSGELSYGLDPVNTYRYVVVEPKGASYEWIKSVPKWEGRNLPEIQLHASDALDPREGEARVRYRVTDISFAQVPLETTREAVGFRPVAMEPDFFNSIPFIEMNIKREKLDLGSFSMTIGGE